MKKVELITIFDEYQDSDNTAFNLEDIIPSEWIGQGYGYKPDIDWNTVDLDEIIYIPECAYGDNEYDDPTSVYTKQDFLDICGNDNDAEELHSMVDWQCPETLYDELDWDDEE